MVLARVREVGLGDVIAPDAFGVDPIRRVHDGGFVDFLATAWAEWTAEGRTHDALPLVWPVRSLRGDRVPQFIDGKLGSYSLDAGVPITAGTWTRCAPAPTWPSPARVWRTALPALRPAPPAGHHAATGHGRLLLYQRGDVASIS
jgi:acetoin utilization deacetylase AcuC-like enzyme